MKQAMKDGLEKLDAGLQKNLMSGSQRRVTVGSEQDQPIADKIRNTSALAYDEPLGHFQRDRSPRGIYRKIAVREALGRDILQKRLILSLYGLGTIPA